MTKKTKTTNDHDDYNDKDGDPKDDNHKDDDDNEDKQNVNIIFVVCDHCPAIGASRHLP